MQFRAQLADADGLACFGGTVGLMVLAGGSDGTENWRLILEAARELTAAGQSPFTRVSVYEWIWRRYPRGEHDRPSLDPVFRGMIRNAPGGLASSAGTPLARVGRGEYVLAGAAPVPGDGSRDPGPRPVPVAGRGGAVSLTEDEVTQGAKEYLEAAGFRVTVAGAASAGPASGSVRRGSHTAGGQRQCCEPAAAGELLPGRPGRVAAADVRPRSGLRASPA
jgi:hypothetical protein